MDKVKIRPLVGDTCWEVTVGSQRFVVVCDRGRLQQMLEAVYDLGFEHGTNP